MTASVSAEACKGIEKKANISDSLEKVLYTESRISGLLSEIEVTLQGPMSSDDATSLPETPPFLMARVFSLGQGLDAIELRLRGILANLCDSSI